MAGHNASPRSDASIFGTGGVEQNQVMRADVSLRSQLVRPVDGTVAGQGRQPARTARSELFPLQSRARGGTINWVAVAGTKNCRPTS
jgi:hypothetical protein